MSPGRIAEVLSVNIRLCLTEIFSNRVRTIITSFGIFLGIGALLTNLSFIRAMRDNVEQNLEKMGGLNVVTINQVEPGSLQEKMRFQRSEGLSIGEMEKLTADLPYVRKVLTTADIGRARVMYRGRDRRARVSAVGLEHAELYDYRIGEGRWFTAEQMSRSQRVCVAGPGVVNRLIPPGESAVGKTMLVRGVPMTVVGVIQTEQRYDRRSREVLIPYSVYERDFGGFHKRVGSVSVLLTGSEHADEFRRTVGTRLLSAHRGVRDFEIQLNEEKIQEQRKAMVGLQAVLWSIAVISLVGGGVSIMNIMFATIGDRIREIGIRKALGARRADVFVQFFTEAILVCFVGGTPGLLLGLAVTSFPPGIFPFTPRLTIMDYFIAFCFTVVSGMMSGLVPALKASGMRPVDALRY